MLCRSGMHKVYFRNALILSWLRDTHLIIFHEHILCRYLKIIKPFFICSLHFSIFSLPKKTTHNNLRWCLSCMRARKAWAGRVLHQFDDESARRRYIFCSSNRILLGINSNIHFNADTADDTRQRLFKVARSRITIFSRQIVARGVGCKEYYVIMMKKRRHRAEEEKRSVCCSMIRRNIYIKINLLHEKWLKIVSHMSRHLLTLTV